ncbi:MAG TPA: DUF6111 family protein [Hyphomicrobiaceae bacterium]|jgi:hypothetical protein|nr:DUF6111 family protein [Hyphomicrobiaceae bacterium]
MIRIVIENILLFLLPTLIYVAYVLLKQRGQGGPGAYLDEAPLLWLFSAGAMLVLITLVAFGSVSGGKPGQTYEPPVFRDGKIEPGRIK